MRGLPHLHLPRNPKRHPRNLGWNKSQGKRVASPRVTTWGLSKGTKDLIQILIVSSLLNPESSIGYKLYSVV